MVLLFKNWGKLYLQLSSQHLAKNMHFRFTDTREMNDVYEDHYRKF